jgi:hypothetical protein
VKQELLAKLLLMQIYRVQGASWHDAQLLALVRNF